MEISNQPDITPNHGRSSKIFVGVVLFIAGLALLAYKMGAPLPGWLFTWPMILILIGLAIGVKDRFQNPGAWIMLLIGSIFLADMNFPGFDAHRYIGPFILIGIGMIFIFRPSRGRLQGAGGCNGRRRMDGSLNQKFTSEPNGNNANATANADEEYININSVFGGVKKFIVSKNFKGGSVVTFMGGAELNLQQADIQHPVILELNNVFGGTKLVVPSNWDVKNEVTAIFGGVDDKRNPSTLTPEPGKTVLIKGTSLFGGIEISGF